MWPRELQDPEVYVRGRTEGTSNRNVEEFGGAFRRFRVSKVSKMLTQVYRYWIALTDCDGIYVDQLSDMPVSEAGSFTRDLKDYARALGKRNFLIIGAALVDYGVQADYLARLGADLDAVFDGPSAGMLRVGLGQSPFEYFKDFDPAQSAMANYRLEGRRTLSMIGHFEGFFSADRLGRRATSAHQGAAVAAIQLFTPGIPALYYGEEQALGSGLDLASRHGLASSYSMVLQREAMFGPIHPLKFGAAGLASGDGRFDQTLPGFGPAGTSGRHAFNNAHPTYLRIAAMISTRQKYSTLRGGVFEVLSVRTDQRGFRQPGEREIGAWARSLAGESLICAVNVNPSETRSVDIAVNASYYPADSELTVVANTMHAAAGKTYTGTHPVTSRVAVKRSGGTTYVELRDVGPSEVIILAGRPVAEDTDFGRVAIQYQQNPYDFGSGYYRARRR